MTVPFGMIHGRFQPFHRGHLDYLRHASQRCEHLIIGLTNPDPSLVAQEEESIHRHRVEANPFTFFQRLLMVQRVVLDEGMDSRRVSIVPFPIHHPDRWPFYTPAHVVHFVTVFSAWEQKKVERLRAAGYQVEVLDLPRLTSATEVRRRLRQGDDWESLVPPGVAAVIHGVQQGRL
jgi:nicotinamide-nucleotide adenylyltransferase